MSSEQNPSGAILSLLVYDDRPWTISELARANGDRLGTIDAVAELDGAGLINRVSEEVVVASRAAIYAFRLAGEGQVL